MNKKISFSILLAGLVLMWYPLSHASAQLVRPGSPFDLRSLVVNVEQAVATIFGLIAVVCFIYAGILFLTAGGQAEKINQAKAAFMWGIAGVVVGILAFSIISIVGYII